MAGGSPSTDDKPVSSEVVVTAENDTDPAKKVGSAVNVNVGDVLAPIADLGKTIFGALFERIALPRRARGEREAALIKVEGERELELLRRAHARQDQRAIRHQETLEAVVGEAMDLIEGAVAAGATAIPPDPQWVEDWSTNAERSDIEEVRNLWARILVGETTRSGSFSRRTLEMLKLISKNEAEWFQKLCSLMFTGANGALYLLRGPYLGMHLVGRGLTHMLLTHVETIGLLMPMGQILSLEEARQFSYGKDHVEVFKKKDWRHGFPELEIVALSSAGDELRRVSTAAPVSGYVDNVIEEINKMPGIGARKLAPTT